MSTTVDKLPPLCSFFFFFFNFHPSIAFKPIENNRFYSFSNGSKCEFVKVLIFKTVPSESVPPVPIAIDVVSASV